MNKILLAHPNKLFLDFIGRFLERHDYEVITTYFPTEILSLALKNLPELIIISKEMKDLNLFGLLFKRQTSPTLKQISIVLSGKFSKEEKDSYKEKSVTGYIDDIANPFHLLDTLNSHFKKTSNNEQKKIPMLLDANIKGNIFIIQIESNFELDRLDLLNYKTRIYCLKNKIKMPKFLFIFPSIEDESITPENLECLFQFLKFPELTIKPFQIKILTTNKKLLGLLKESDDYKDFEIVSNYILGLEQLNVDFDKSKEIPVKFLKAGSYFILDLFDKSGNLKIRGNTPITEELIDSIKAEGHTHLIYFSDRDLTDVTELTTDNNEINFDRLNLVISTTANVEETKDFHSNIEDSKEDKIKLLFNKIQGLDSLVISDDHHDLFMIKNTLSNYLNIEARPNGKNLPEIINKGNFVCVFIDIRMASPNALEILDTIRKLRSRKQTTVIILSKKIDKQTVELLRSHGTNYIILSPFSKDTLVRKVYDFITNDRE
ncbi:MAG: hypothetical protein A2086_04320 [Spirochaetes bacterium GWD1_27_9]|nr:MAG: hypothetical protein A2Z98_06095 [Spirochaetes bacterium GWB1_27_13]OHD41383.1 MAG: hypothetical protein A2086_04320 [Spirochaetes bacterium GWD1_27_9]